MSGIPRHSAVSMTARAQAMLKLHVSDINARAITQHALTAARQRSGKQEPPIDSLLEELSRSSAIFLEPAQRAEFLQQLQNAAPANDTGSELVARCIPVRSERDLKHTRTAVKELCDELGLSGFPAQKIITAVSELARNIAKYVGDGRIVLESGGRNHGLTVRAEDRGPGIPNLQQILGGSYRSKTGMGRGLLGVRTLADQFEIQTGPEGTNITLTFRRPGHLSTVERIQDER